MEYWAPARAGGQCSTGPYNILLGTGGWHRRRRRRALDMNLQWTKIMSFTVLHDTVGNGTVVRNRTCQLKEHSFLRSHYYALFHIFTCVCHYYISVNNYYVIISFSGCIITYLTFIIVYYYLCYYIINMCIITYYYRKNRLITTVRMGSLLPIITRSIIGNNGFVVTY
jgi:hypothetical protein